MQSKPRKKKCACRLCKRDARYKRLKASRKPSVLRALIDEMYETMFMAEFDNNYYNAILDGSWPQAVEILERALKTAKEIKAVRDAEEAVQGAKA